MKAALFAILLTLNIGLHSDAATPLATSKTGPPLKWFENYSKAIEDAKRSNKNVMLYFSDSTPSAACKVLETGVLDTRYFKAWARNDFILVQVDFSKNAMSNPEIQAQNDGLRAKYSATIPTILIINPNGLELAMKTAFGSAMPVADGYAKELQAALKK